MEHLERSEDAALPFLHFFFTGNVCYLCEQKISRLKINKLHKLNNYIKQLKIGKSSTDGLMVYCFYLQKLVDNKSHF